MTGTEHLAWCKKRALEYLDHGELEQAVTSMTSDLSKHPDTSMAPASMAMFLLLATIYVRDRDVDGVRRWIEGFR